MAGAGPRLTERTERTEVVSPGLLPVPQGGREGGRCCPRAGEDFGGFLYVAASPVQTFPPCVVAGLTGVDVLTGARQPVSIPRDLLACPLSQRWSRRWDSPGFILLDERVCRCRSPRAAGLLGRSAGAGQRDGVSPSVSRLPPASLRELPAPAVPAAASHSASTQVGGGLGRCGAPRQGGSGGWVLLGGLLGGHRCEWHWEGWWKARCPAGAVRGDLPWVSSIL